MSTRLAIYDDNDAPTRLRPTLRSLSPSPSTFATSLRSFTTDLSSAKRWKHSKWRHTVGIILLLITVFLWTASNFLASTIFADNTFSKPYFVTYTNSAFFILPLVPTVLKELRSNPQELSEIRDWIRRAARRPYVLARSADPEETAAFLKPDQGDDNHDPLQSAARPEAAMEMEDSAEQHASQILGSRQPSFQLPTERLRLVDTARLSLEFCFLWFIANYFTAACLEYTTVASSTILTSTSSIWTLLCGTIVGVERFTFRKLLGVLASLTGIVLISTVDISGKNDENRGTFPHKTPREIAIGDALAFVSAVMYGIYSVVMKKKIGDESKVNMPLFFGLVGLFNVILLWPGFIILHLTGIETFELPPDGRVLAIVLTNSTSSLISDFCWAYSMLLTSPLVTTVGLSMTIPLSLIGQMVLDSQYSSATYWVGAGIVLLSFIFVNHEEVKDEEEEMRHEEEEVAAVLGTPRLEDDSLVHDVRRTDAEFNG
jgi:solute carrier family 35, member F5